MSATSEPTATTASDPTVVGSRSVLPRRPKVIRRRFDPWARPGPRGVRTIIRVEARRWRIAPSALARRVRCESRLRWWAGNGLYRGLLQFSPSTFYRGFRTIKSRRVRLIRRWVRRVRGRRVVRYSDGRVVRTRGRPRRQRVI